MTYNNSIIALINKELAITIPDKASAEELRQQLSAEINELVLHDFQKLVSILYRLDVNESKLKHLIQQNPDAQASLIIADLIIEREAQKIKSRQQYSQRDNTIDENEKW